ncbi:MAG: nucleotide-binding universal stress UspA family protein [Verrucomicrobiales bacterium]|jgi:nucleotide-binding universal stress UspA family protein
MIQEILVPFNGSDETRRAVEVGAGLARAAERPLRIFAYSEKPGIPAHSAALYELADLISVRYGLSPQITSVPTFRFLGDELISQSARRPGSVIAIPSSGPGRRALVMGSLATDVLTYNPGPTILVGPECESPTFEAAGPMVIALDGSHESERILDVAHEWAQVFHLEVDIITVLDPVFSSATASAIASGDIVESAYVAQVAQRSPIASDHPTYDVLHGRPADEIVREATDRNASLIAMASSVPHGVDRLLHGSILDSVTRHSPVPILALGTQPRTTSRQTS